MPNYIAIIHKDSGTSFGVSFPDFPGCITAGDTLDEAFRLAHEILPFHIRGMEEDDEPIPEPSGLEAVMANPDFSDGIPFLVHVADLPGKRVRIASSLAEPPALPESLLEKPFGLKTRLINITMDERLLKRVDEEAKRQGKTRSAFLADAARQAIVG